MIFKDPLILILIPVTAALIFYFQKYLRGPSLRFSSTQLLSGLSENWKVILSRKFYILRMMIICLFLIALAGPRLVLQETKHTAEGIDIVLAIDCSGSMAAEDFRINGQRQNRLLVVKNVVADFILKRSDDRIGMVAFAGRAYNVCPLTTDHDWLISNLDRVELNMLEDGTAIGSAVSSSLSRLKDSKAKSRIIILLTDGMSNAGTVTPLVAAQAARALGVKIYTIGAGTKGFAPFPVQGMFGQKVYQNVQIDVDEETLNKIAETTGGRFFRATDTESLKNIYQEIDKLEKTKIEETGYKEYRELFVYVLALALILLAAEAISLNTFLVRIP